jgi:Zn-dependent peptidase ImmA (M78 family)
MKITKTGTSELASKERYELAEQAKLIKTAAGLSSDTPIGNNMHALLSYHKIVLLENPIARAGSDSFSAMFMRTKADSVNFSFIGVNTSDYYDKQLFAIAHELYHFYVHDNPHISRDGNPKSPEERKAEYFAAELMLPLDVIKRIIMKEFGTSVISTQSMQVLLRFVARLHCTWWLPYKAIVKRLLEAGAVTSTVYNELYAVDERTKSAPYHRIGLSTNFEYFTLLNTVTEKVGTSATNLENAIRNFEDDIISEDELIRGLQLFNFKPEDFGIEIDSDISDEEWEAFCIGGASDEG